MFMPGWGLAGFSGCLVTRLCGWLDGGLPRYKSLQLPVEEAPPGAADNAEHAVTAARKIMKNEVA